MDSLIYLTESLMEIGPCSSDIDFDAGHPDKSTNDFLMRGVLRSYRSSLEATFS